MSDTKHDHGHAHGHAHSHGHEHTKAALAEGEVELDPMLFGTEQPCFGCGPSHPIGFHLRFTRQNDVVRTRWTPGAQYQGPPNIVHGGLVTTLADELAAWTVVALRGRFGFTASIEARLSAPLRIGVEAVGEGRVLRDSSRLVLVEVRIKQKLEECFRGEFKFVLLDAAGAEKLLGGPLPEHWKQFAR